MYVCKYPHLFSPIRLGDTVFRNRFFNAPVGYEYLSCEKHPLEETVAFYERSDAEVGSKRLFEADVVICATGREPLRTETDALRFCAPEFHEIGDCWIPRNMQQATRMASAVARDI